ncbi:MAG: sugar phosphate nucleotidyltransferase, partial [bacterium]
IFDNKSLLEITYNRLKDLSIFDEIFVCANKKHYYLIKRDLNIHDDRIILEEDSKNTAFAILYSSYNIKKMIDNDLFLYFFPSDHYIFNEEEFENSVMQVTKYLTIFEKTFIIGVKPTFPSVLYGYIKKSNKVFDNLYSVGRFIEKPNKARASYYYKSQGYLWNSGIYIFSFDFFVKDFFTVNKDLEIYKDIDFFYENFESFPNISIDYLYSQKSRDLFVLESFFGWSDLGSFEEISKIVNFEGCDNKGKVFKINSLVDFLSDEVEARTNKKYCFIDVKDLVIVDTKDFQLISKKGHTKKISQILERIEEEQKEYNTFDFRPWGYYQEIFNEESRYRIKKIIVYPFGEISVQYHNHRDEYWIILKGEGKILIDQKENYIRQGDFIHIPKWVINKVFN